MGKAKQLKNLYKIILRSYNDLKNSKTKIFASWKIFEIEQKLKLQDFCSKKLQQHSNNFLIETTESNTNETSIEMHRGKQKRKIRTDSRNQWKSMFVFDLKFKFNLENY